jgi:hypothetical protein
MSASPRSSRGSIAQSESYLPGCDGVWALHKQSRIKMKTDLDRSGLIDSGNPEDLNVLVRGTASKRGGCHFRKVQNKFRIAGIGRWSKLNVWVWEWIIYSGCRCFCRWSCIQDSARNPISTRVWAPEHLGQNHGIYSKIFTQAVSY